MNNKETIKDEAGESDSVNERSADSIAESVKNILNEICNSVRGLIRNVVFATQISATAFGVIGCGTSPEECFREKLFLNFDGQTLSCGDLRKNEGHFVYDVGYYCDGKTDEERVDIEPYEFTPDGFEEDRIPPECQSFSDTKEKITAVIRARLEPLGIEVFTDPDLSTGVNVLTIGGVGKTTTSGQAILGNAQMDTGNLEHDNLGQVAQRFADDRTDLCHSSRAPWQITKTIIHEALHMLGVPHAKDSDPYSIMSVNYIDQVDSQKESCQRGLSPDEAEILAKNLRGSCNNQGVPFDVLKKAALLSSAEAIQACLDL